ncbi:TNT domain-containing protein, partial [Psychrobacter sp. HII-4]|uniref:TNT domain-containing protein n=1 Tax=Psychrobacter sp. HII-4 TaxID=1569264 RepID=UPI001919E584
IMNTAVGIMQTEQVGRIKKTFVGKSYSITAGDEFKITVGKSSLVMNADGSIIITGSSIITQAEKENKVIGKDVLINPPGGGAGGGDDEYDYEEGSIIPGTNTTVGDPVEGGGGDTWTAEQWERQASNINKNVMNNNGSIHSGSMPAYQQQQNQKTADAVMTAASVVPIGRVGQTVHKGSKVLKAARATKAANLKLLNAINKERALAQKANWKKPDGSIWWPDNTKGFDKVPGTLTTHNYRKGQGFSRYSDYAPKDDRGAYVSPKGTTFSERAMYGKESDYIERQFEVLKDIPAANRSQATPWFDQRGMGMQDQLPMPIKDLIKDGYIKYLE